MEAREMRSIHDPGKPRSIHLTDKGREAIGLKVYVPVPLINFPWRREELEDDQALPRSE